MCAYIIYYISFFLFIMRVLRKAACPPLNLKFFLKSTRPSLPLKKAPPLISVFSPQGKRGNRSFSSL